MRTIKKLIIHWYFSVRNAWPLWFYLLNMRGRRLLRLQHMRLTKVQTQILGDLARDGIARTTLDELFPQEELLAILHKFVRDHAPNARAYTKKEFLSAFWPTKPDLDLLNPFVALSVRPEILAVTNSYMGMWTRLNYYHLATAHVTQSEATQSQRWHRDPEEVRMIKMFIYLTDVDEGSGPFIYVRGSSVTGKGPYARVLPQQLPEGIYPPAAAVEKQVSPENILVSTGKAGTVLFCDTTGLHRGGHAEMRERTMFTAFYTAASWSESPRYTYQNFLNLDHLPDPARYALGFF